MVQRHRIAGEELRCAFERSDSLGWPVQREEIEPFPPEGIGDPRVIERVLALVFVDGDVVAFERRGELALQAEQRAERHIEVASMGRGSAATDGVDLAQHGLRLVDAAERQEGFLLVEHRGDSGDVLGPDGTRAEVAPETDEMQGLLEPLLVLRDLAEPVENRSDAVVAWPTGLLEEGHRPLEEGSRLVVVAGEELDWPSRVERLASRKSSPPTREIADSA